MRRQPGLVIGFGIAAVLAIVVGGLGAALVRRSDAAPMPFTSDAVTSATATPAPSTASIRHDPSSIPPRPAAATSKPTEGAKPATKPAAKWSKPQQVERADCESVSAVIDARGGNHVAMGCRGEIHYLDLDTDDWDPVRFKSPEDLEEYGPQLAIDGDILYLAYSRVAVEESCGDGLRDVGVYYRTRKVSGGRQWSDPARIGEVGDTLHTLRVAGGVIHATVGSADGGHFYYETLRSGSHHRYEIPQATGMTSLRIGDDGRARIAYEGGGSLRYATFTGAGFSSQKIPGTSRGYGPALVLGANDRPYLMWFRGNRPGGGCAEPEPPPDAGTYYSSEKAGTWTSERLTTQQDVASVTVDTASGRVHVLVSDKRGHLGYMTKAGKAWSKRTIDTLDVTNAVIRLDQDTGDLLVAYVSWDGEVQRPFVVTKR